MRGSKLPFYLSFSILLFAFPLLIRCFWAFVLSPVPYLTPDEILYPKVARLYVHGLFSGDLSVFRANAAHPPLSKLITALFIFLLGPFGFSDIGALRMQGCLFSAFTCIVAYLAGSSVDRRVGILSWALLSLDPISIRFSIASLDATSLLFASLSISTFLRSNAESKRGYLLSGLFLGLAGLCKYTVYPIVLGTLALILISRKVSSNVALRIPFLVATSLALFFLGNPLFWPSWLTGFSGYDALLREFGAYSVGARQSVLTPLDWLGTGWGTPQMMFHLSMFAHGIMFYPFDLFQSSYLPWIFLGSVLQLARRKTMPKFTFMNLLWFSATFIFFWLLAKSRAELYYSVWLQPPAAIVSSYSVTDEWRKLRR